VDAKLYSGLIEIRDLGGWLRSDLRLFVGGRDRSKKVENMRWQVSAIDSALAEAGYKELPPVTPVVCFVDGKWRWPIAPPQSYHGIWLEDARSIIKFMSQRRVFDSEAISHISRALASAFPPK
jgi:hypothetical protein